MAKRYGPPDPIDERPIRSKMLGHKGPLRFALRLGEIQRVDYENMVCDIHWLQGSLPPSREVPITGAYWSKRGFLGAMPEQGSIAVCGFSAVHENHGVRPYVLAFLPNGFKTALGFDPLGIVERDADDIDEPLETLQKELDGIYGPTRHRMRKLYPGDIYGASDKGAEFLLDRDVRLLSNAGSEIWLRGEDQSLITTTLDAYNTTAASRRRSGRITRSALTVPSGVTFGEDGRIPEGSQLFEFLVDSGIIFEDGTLTPDVNSLPFITLESGERLALVTENLEDPTTPDVRVYTEDRVEIQEFSDQNMPFPDHYGFDADKIGEEEPYRPFIEKVSGTVVGNDPYTARGRTNYGKLLKPVVFDTPSSINGQPRMEAVKNEEGETEKSLVGAHLYRMERPDGLGELFISHDKEGHVFMSIPASTSKKSNLGAGRSVEADIKGSVKAVIGANKNDRASLDVFAVGGAKWTLGTLDRTGRSLDITAKGGVGIKANSDVDGSAVKAELTGDVALAIEGSYGLSATEDHLVEINGKKQLDAEARETSIGNGDDNLTVLSNRNFTVKGNVGKSIGEGRKTTITKSSPNGPNAENLRILQGNRATTFGAPATDKVSFATTGTRTVQAGGALTANWQAGASGNFSFRAASGSYSVTLGLGTISMTSANINMTASTAVNIQAPTVNVTGKVALGNPSAALAVIGGVPGPSPYIDPLTGLPLTGNPLVTVPPV